MELPAVNLKAILFIHWLLTVFAGLVEWVPNAYYVSNVSVLAIGVWAVAQRDSADAIFMFFIGLALTVLTDILIFALYYAGMEKRYDDTALRDLFRFSGGMAILSLLLKPLSCFFSYHMYCERGGECSVNFGFMNVSRDRASYQTIDHVDAPAEDNKTAPRSY